MASDARRPIRCAIYTRKSTEHGLELEFNSLDAQREACDAYIKSQASQGWKALPQHYDDAAFSGGTLDRPALQQLLADIDAGHIDVIVVYKIDRLTRSLADFAKLVEKFDRRSISFVAVTQQFNTTSSMGRLTLNVLLSFAQFERELASERVRDKVAASRRKGKWTGGTVPLGYDARNKKLVINPGEAETVRTIFRRYLELGSLSQLVPDLDRKGIVTKQRDTKLAKYRGGIPFSYGPLAHLLRNRTYLGEIHHGGKWYRGEHEAILDQTLFDLVQNLMRQNSSSGKSKRLASGALLRGKLFDDRNNRMYPSFSVKNGVRYRFYVSSTLLKGRKAAAGSVSRVAAQQIEDLVIAKLKEQLQFGPGTPVDVVCDSLERVTMSTEVTTVIARAPGSPPDALTLTIEIPWQPPSRNKSILPPDDDATQSDPKLLHALVRAHAWLQALIANQYTSVEALAQSVGLHPKIVRHNLRLAYLSHDFTGAILTGQTPHSLASIPRLLPLLWSEQPR